MVFTRKCVATKVINHFGAYLKICADIMAWIRKWVSNIYAEIVLTQRSEQDFDLIS